MNKRNILIIATVFLTVFILVSCRSDGPAGVDIGGLWSGSVYASDSDESGLIVMEISEGGKFRMGDPDGGFVYDDAINQSISWSLDENYFILTDWFYMYYAEYAWTLSEDGNSLTLFLIQRNFFNSTFDDIQPGARLTLTKDEEHDFSYYFSSEYTDSPM